MTAQHHKPRNGGRAKQSGDAPKALIIDNDETHSARLTSYLQDAGFQATVTDNPDQANDDFCIVFLCLDLPSKTIASLLSGPVSESGFEVVLMAAEDDPFLVRKAISKGASYFFCKPFDPEFIKPLLADVYSDAVTNPGRVNEQDIATLDQFGLLRGSSPPMRRLFRIIRKVAPTDASILLVGESGTGKELVAKTLHHMSEAADQPFVAMNCAAIPKELFESEMFGHEKGSFSGADQQHAGFFERAENGTLFLDELTEMPTDLQVKLLRVLESGAFRRVGGETDLKTNVRIVAATNCDPDEAIRDGRMREDLYYRIARFPVHLPPLRARTSDIHGLAQFFLKELNKKNGTHISLDQSALKEIQGYHWPGNVREMQSVIERAYILAEHRITADHLPDFKDTLIGGQLRISVGESIESAEKKLIFATLEANDGDKKLTAETLGVSLKTLYNRLNQYSDEESAQSNEEQE